MYVIDSSVCSMCAASVCVCSLCVCCDLGVGCVDAGIFVCIVRVACVHICV